MIFTALGLLVVAAGLLIAGIAKSSVALLMASLLLTIGSAVVLAMVLPAARKLAESNGTPNAQIVGLNGGTAQPVVLYVQQAPPAGDTNGHSPIVGYDDMTATQITTLIGSGALTDEQLDAVRDYEASHAARRSVLAKLS
jgi:hypothetical protein